MHPTLQETNMQLACQGEGSYTYQCDKPACWFCESIKPHIHNDEVINIEDLKLNRRWTEKEDLIILANIDIENVKLCKMVKRSYNSIKCRKTLIRKIYNKPYTGNFHPIFL